MGEDNMFGIADRLNPQTYSSHLLCIQALIKITCFGVALDCIKLMVPGVSGNYFMTLSASYTSRLSLLPLPPC